MSQPDPLRRRVAEVSRDTEFLNARVNRLDKAVYLILVLSIADTLMIIFTISMHAVKVF